MYGAEEEPTESCPSDLSSRHLRMEKPLYTAKGLLAPDKARCTRLMRVVESQRPFVMTVTIQKQLVKLICLFNGLLTFKFPTEMWLQYMAFLRKC